jgi:predicted amidohydrolase
MHAALCQFDLAWEDPAANRSRVEQLLAAAPVAPGSLVVLPEMFATGFSMNDAVTAEPEGGASELFLADIARRLQVTLVAGLAVRGPDAQARNQALAFSPDGALLSRFTKLHPFTLGKEHEHYIPGDEVQVFPWGDLSVAPLVCYDLRFPEAFRAGVRRGAQVFTVIANWPAVRIQHWITLLRARAIENQAFVIGVNRCGRDPSHVYPGRSLVIDPLGEVLADAGEHEGVVHATLNVPTLHQWRNGFPALRDQRHDLGG